MAVSNRERIGRALEHLREGMRPYVEQEMRESYGEDWLSRYAWDAPNGEAIFDTQALLKSVINHWDEVFSRRLDRDALSLAHEARKSRNRYAHEEPFETDDAYVALHQIQKLLEALDAPQAEDVEKLKVDLLRHSQEEKARREARKASSATVEGAVLPGLKPWREVVNPHEDVAQGTYQQAEFAADLWQVYKGGGTSEYKDPIEFYGRTYLTEGLRELLVNALKRLAGQGGDPVVELQINFGGGKTHSMLALRHLFSGVKATDLPGVEEVLRESAIAQPAAVRQAILVGNQISPGSPLHKEDGTTVNTLWGEMAWQLGGRKGYEILRSADDTATNPGDALDLLFETCGPCLILIDEWVAYARQLYGRERMLPAGSFDTQFTFAQTLCEAARRSRNVLVVVSIPASVSEQGDTGGQSALDSLKQAVGRSNLIWRPATSDESFEIVRRRLFQPLGDTRYRDAALKAFMDYYRANPQEFPSECREAEYERRMTAAYPIHPELFDRLYNDWSTLEKFHKTRGVLRLMAAVIHSLWKRGDKSVLILPAHVPVDDPNVQPELTRYLEERWTGVIDGDVDGPNSAPMRMDGENVNFGRYHACRRVARTVFLGSAPTLHAAAQGLEDKRVKLGCAQPGESPATFGDALRKLSDRTTFLYVSGTRYWYSTQASLNQAAKGIADRDDIRDRVEDEMKRRLQENVRSRGVFSGAHVFPTTSGDIPDDRHLRLVVLGPRSLHKQGNLTSAAIQEATETLKLHGGGHRDYRNMLVFAACDQTRYHELEAAVRMHLAWKHIVEHPDDYELTPAKKKQAEDKRDDLSRTIEVKVGEVYQWALAPTQPPQGSDPDVVARWEEFRCQGTDPLAVRVGKKLRNEQVLTTELGGNVLKHEMDRVPLWRGDHVSIAQLEEDFARYLYLPRLTSISILHDAIRDAVGNLDNPIGYARSHDEATGRYEGLVSGVMLGPERQLSSALLVKPDVTQAYLDLEDEEERNRQASGQGEGTSVPDGTGLTADSGGITPRGVGSYHNQGKGATGEVHNGKGGPIIVPALKTRFHGSIEVDPLTFREQAGKVSHEVIQHLVTQFGADVRVTIEIQASTDDGFPEATIRTVSENCRVLSFQSFDFEEE